MSHMKKETVNLKPEFVLFLEGVYLELGIKPCERLR